MFYIGLTKLSEFLLAANPFALYVSPLTVTRREGEYTATVTTSLVVSQVDQNQLLYCKIDISRWNEVGNQLFSDESTAIAQRAPRLQQKIWEIAVERIHRVQFDWAIFEAAPSFPRDLLLIPGSIDGVTYNAELEDYEEQAAA